MFMIPNSLNKSTLFCPNRVIKI